MEGIIKLKLSKDGKTYSPVAVCFPLGFGLEKAFNNDLGIKIEARIQIYNDRLFR